MPTHKSAEKRQRQNIKIRARNRNTRSAIATSIKKSLKSIKENDLIVAESAANHTMKLIDTAKSKSVLHKNTAARKISRLMKKVNQAKTA